VARKGLDRKHKYSMRRPPRMGRLPGRGDRTAKERSARRRQRERIAEENEAAQASQEDVTNG
jgi:hypothetical protein